MNGNAYGNAYANGDDYEEEHGDECECANLKTGNGKPMRLGYQFEKARRILAGLGPGELERLRELCTGIRDAEGALLAAAGEKMHRCTAVCRGLCCRNVQLDAVIGLWDFVYILALEGANPQKMAACLAGERPFFSSDCIFLEDGVGPCIFPADVRPEICVTAFCTDDTPIRREIARVRRAYLKLIWRVRLAAFRKWAGGGGQGSEAGGQRSDR